MKEDESISFLFYSISVSLKKSYKRTIKIFLNAFVYIQEYFCLIVKVTNPLVMTMLSCGLGSVICKVILNKMVI